MKAFDMRRCHGHCVSFILLGLTLNVQAATAVIDNTKLGTTSGVGAGGLFQVLIGLGIVLALMFGVAWLMKRFGMARGASTQLVKVIGGASVGHRERVVVVEVGGQWIVVGVAPGRVNALATMPREAALQDGSSESALNKVHSPTMHSAALAGYPAPVKNFASWLNTQMNKPKNSGNHSEGDQ